MITYPNVERHLDRLAKVEERLLALMRASTGDNVPLRSALEGTRDARSRALAGTASATVMSLTQGRLLRAALELTTSRQPVQMDTGRQLIGFCQELLRAEAELDTPQAACQTLLQLIWFERDTAAAVRRERRFADILAAFHDRPPEHEEYPPGFDATAGDIEDWREIFEVIAHGKGMLEGDRNAAVEEALRPDGGTIQPLIMLDGELSFPFDELEVLRATVSLAAPFAASDSAVRGLNALAKRFLTTTGHAGAPTVAGNLAKRIVETITERSLADRRSFEAERERSLIEIRGFQTRLLFGDVHRRALYNDSVTAYLGPDIAARLPGARKLRARLLARVHPRIDCHEKSVHCLRILAIALVSPSAGP